MTRLNHYDSHHIKQKEGGVSKFNILAHRLYFRPNGEGDDRICLLYTSPSPRD